MTEEKKETIARDDSRAIAETIIRTLDFKRARDLKLLRVEDKTTLADYYVFATGGSRTQILALAGEVEDKLEERGVPVGHIEGRGSGEWVLMDYGSVAVHIFSREGREFYNLEKLWSDCETVPIDALLVKETEEER